MIFKRNYISKEQRESVLLSKFGNLEIGNQADIKYMRDNRLTYKARGIMAYYFSHDSGWLPLQKDLEQKSEKDSRYVISQGINELITCGYVTRTKRGKGKGKGFSWELVIYEVALDNPAYDPYEHGIAYYSNGSKSKQEKQETLDTLILSQLAQKGGPGVVIAEDDFSDILKPGLYADETPIADKPTAKPKDHLDHAMKIKQGQHKAISGKVYSPYAIKIQETFNSSKQIIDPSRVMALGAFLYAYKKVSGQEFPIPGALEDKKYWGKTAGKHLDNYSLEQLAPMYIVAINLHLKDDLSLLSPDSISKKLVEAYQVLSAKAKAKAKTQAKINEAKASYEEKSYEQQEEDLAQLTLNKASGRSGAAKNSPHMWRGFIFDNETDMYATINYFGWADKRDNETESEIRQLLSKDELKLINPLSMSELGDLFHFRTKKEDNLLFRAYVLTQRAMTPNFDPTTLRLEKTTPLRGGLETCELPDFYKSIAQTLSMPVKANNILAQFEALEQLADLGEN